MEPFPAAEKPLRAQEVSRGELRLFTQRNLAQDLGLVGGAFRLSGDLPDDEPLLSGSMYQIRQLQPGLILHRTQVRDLCDFSSHVEQHPGIKLCLLVSGATQVAYGRHAFELGPATESGRCNQGALVAMSEPDGFRRTWRSGRSERKISITLKPEWLESTGFGAFGGQDGLVAFAREHMSERTWYPSQQALRAAEQILAPPPMAPPLQEIFLQSRCLDIVVDALAMVAGPQVDDALHVRERQRMRKVCELLDSGAADAWSLAQIARHAGRNATCLQRDFRAYTGATIFDYQRSRRLLAAHDALCRRGVRVEDAAEIAGYTSAANFATAFKRRFGLTPRQARSGRALD